MLDFFFRERIGGGEELKYYCWERRKEIKKKKEKKKEFENSKRNERGKLSSLRSVVKKIDGHVFSQIAQKRNDKMSFLSSQSVSSNKASKE